MLPITATTHHNTNMPTSTTTPPGHIPIIEGPHDGQTLPIRYIRKVIDGTHYARKEVQPGKWAFVLAPVIDRAKQHLPGCWVRDIEERERRNRNIRRKEDEQ